MKRLIALILILQISEPAWASWTFVNSGSNSAVGSTASLTFNIASVNVGDSVMIAVKWEGGDTTVTCSATSTTFVDAFVGAHVTNVNGGTITMCYALSSGTSGTVTFTVTWGAARTFKDIGGMAYRPSAAASTDGAGHMATGNAATATSGNTTTTGTDGVAFGMFGETGESPTYASAAINSVTRDQVLAFGSAVHSGIWSKTYSAGFTGAATVPVGTNDYACGIYALNIAGGAAAPVASKSKMRKYEALGQL